MNELSQVLAALAVIANAVVYGTDVYCAMVQRPAMAHLGDRSLTSVMGQIHRFGDQRMPVPGVLGLILTLAAAVTAALAGSAAPAVSAGVAVVCLVTWLVVYGRVSAPINKELTRASADGRAHDNAHELQRRWDSVINLRAVLQGVGVVGAAVALVLAS